MHTISSGSLSVVIAGWTVQYWLGTGGVHLLMVIISLPLPVQVLRLEGRLGELEEVLSATQSGRAAAEQEVQQLREEVQQTRTLSEHHVQVGRVRMHCVCLPCIGLAPCVCCPGKYKRLCRACSACNLAFFGNTGVFHYGAAATVRISFPGLHFWQGWPVVRHVQCS